MLVCTLKNNQKDICQHFTPVLLDIQTQGLNHSTKLSGVPVLS